jgi:hypothetical protein
VDRHQDKDPVIEDEQVEDLDVETGDAEDVKGGAAASMGYKWEPGVDAQHNETLLRA